MNAWTSMILRYFILLVLGLGNLFIFYLIATPLTVYPVFYLISIFYDASLSEGTYTGACELVSNIPAIKNIACMDTTVFFKGYYASIIPACIAGSAYFLLLILNLSTPMEKKQRIKSLFFLMVLFLFLNILRIFSFAVIYANKGFELFNIAHVASWYFGSTVLVILLWFSSVFIFKIKSIPVYTDLKSIISQIKGEK